MCGIAGVRVAGGSLRLSELALEMAASLRHRGPDAIGFWSDDKTISLGHTRLAIIDVGSSEQPMATPDERVVLVFNGEILNYKELRRNLSSYPFRTNGDTEVLLALYEKYGPAGVKKLRGQFAYAIHDTVTNETHIFRDRIGVLPLYYYADSRLFAFASEIKALLPLLPDAAVDDESLCDYLSHRAVPAPFTLIRGVRKLLPGHHLVVKGDGTVSSTPYWHLPNDGTHLNITASEAVRGVDELLTKSVSESLAADVPVGVYLSGGIDSSLLTALAIRGNRDQILHTFSATFGDPRVDEGGWARRVSGLLGTIHQEVVVTDDDFLQNWARLSWFRDGPLSEPADIAINCLAQLARTQVKVVLSGEGSDEIFGGYPKYRYALATRWCGGPIQAGLLQKLERSLPASRNQLRIAIRAISEPTYAERMRGWFAPFTGEERRSLIGRAASRSTVGPYLSGVGDPLRRMLYADMSTWLVDNLLERGDRMSMAASLETRPPFLDYRLVEFAFRLPSRYKVRRRRTKWILKEVARKYLPNDVIDRPKVGFKVPLDNWIRSGLRDFACDHLSARSSYVGSVFSSREIDKLLEDHLSGRRNEETRIWTLLSLEVWHREMTAKGFL